MGEFAVILFIFYTKPKAELIAEEMLVKDGFEVFLPKMNQCSIWKNRQRKTIVKPLIASYIFVYTPEQQIVKVLANPKIVAVVTCGGKKAVLRQEDIVLLQSIARLQKNINSTNNYQVGKRVRFIRGALAGLEGKIIYLNFVIVLCRLNIQSSFYSLLGLNPSIS